VEITPETIARAYKSGTRSLLAFVPERFSEAGRTCESLPTVVHGVELSIGSAHGWNTAYLDLLDSFSSQWSFLWHSEHLSFQTIPGQQGDTLEVGVPLPLPPTLEAARIVAERCTELIRRYKVPFLLENAAQYLSGLPCDPGIDDDAGLVREIVDRSGCYLLLDLHNIYCSSVNLGQNMFALVDSMPLDRVLEIHIAGGSWRDGFWMDAHDGQVPEPVWELLDYVLPRALEIRGIVFEILEEHAQQLGVRTIERELVKARKIWHRHRSEPSHVAC
jgi:uncharacterized protein (UPF0276 family)